jgi:GWxTD domain-containing protein
MKKYSLILFVLLSFNISGQKSINFDFDYARFAYDSASNFVEFYYSFNQDDLTITKNNSGLFCKASLLIMLQDTVSKNYIINKNWRIENPIKDSIELKNNKSLVGVVGFVIPKGIYWCKITGSDGVDSSRSETIQEFFNIIPFESKKISISDIQVSSNIKQEGADPKSIFYKNTLEVIPNPTMVYGKEMPVLFYYTELYNLNVDSTSHLIKLRTNVFNSRGQKLFDKNKVIPRNNNSRVEVGTLNLTKYPTDTYTLLISLFDSVSNYGTSTGKRFFIYNPSIKDTSKFEKGNIDILSSQFNVLSDEECDQLFDKSKYTSSSAESEQYDNIDSVKGKREFLYQFWKRRDKDPSTPENEFYNEYMERVRICNEKYGVINRTGMKTDRGRVYIIYGEPDEIDRYPNDLDKKPYEIWQYHQIEGGVVFIFGVVKGF